MLELWSDAPDLDAPMTEENSLLRGKKENPIHKGWGRVLAFTRFPWRSDDHHQLTNDQVGQGPPAPLSAKDSLLRKPPLLIELLKLIPDKGKEAEFTPERREAFERTVQAALDLSYKSQ